MIMVLAGTSDGREIVHALASRGLRVAACAATPYGARLLDGSGAFEVTGRPLNRKDLSGMVAEHQIRFVVDATHPYAEKVSTMAVEVCTETGVRYIRYQRPATQFEIHPLLHRAGSYDEAAEKAAELGETIFLTTGSKTLEIFLNAAKIKGRRVVARLLPQPGVLERCFELGLNPADIVAIQGPFGTELNEALLRHYKASVMVTKDGGTPGGTEEKIKAALNLGIPVVVVDRPSHFGEPVGSIPELLERIKEDNSYGNCCHFAESREQVARGEGNAGSLLGNGQ